MMAFVGQFVLPNSHHMLKEHTMNAMDYLTTDVMESIVIQTLQGELPAQMTPELGSLTS
tara:strand:- start:416 stop:592 length:177 start_codon:yes stop_codon:yes gene_type:complete